MTTGGTSPYFNVSSTSLSIGTLGSTNAVIFSKSTDTTWFSLLVSTTVLGSLPIADLRVLFVEPWKMRNFSFRS